MKIPLSHKKKEENKMAKTGHFLHSISNTTPIVGVGTTYDVTKVHPLDLNIRRSPYKASQQFKGFLETLLFSVSNVAGGGTTITCRLCIDPNGDLPAIGDVQVPIDFGITTGTSGTCQVLYDHFGFDDILGADTLYVFYKIDAGTCDVGVSQVNWSE